MSDWLVSLMDSKCYWMARGMCGNMAVRAAELTVGLRKAVRVVELTVVLRVAARVVELIVVLRMVVRVVELTVVIRTAFRVVELGPRSDMAPRVRPWAPAALSAGRDAEQHDRIVVHAAAPHYSAISSG